MGNIKSATNLNASYRTVTLKYRVSIVRNRISNNNTDAGITASPFVHADSQWKPFPTLVRLASASVRAQIDILDSPGSRDSWP